MGGARRDGAHISEGGQAVVGVEQVVEVPVLLKFAQRTQPAIHHMPHAPVHARLCGQGVDVDGAWVWV